MRNLSVFLLLLGLLSAGLSPALEHSYGEASPTVSSPGSARTYALNVHGTVVYLTSQEHWLLFGSFYGGLSLAMAGAFLLQRTMRRAQVDAA